MIRLFIHPDGTTSTLDVDRDREMVCVLVPKKDGVAYAPRSYYMREFFHGDRVEVVYHHRNEGRTYRR